MDISTLNYYNKNAKAYIQETSLLDMSLIYERFLRHIPEKGILLDAGCGSCRDTLYFNSLGYRVHAIDASIDLVAQAQKTFSFPIECISFQQFLMPNQFDGIWACASLLHLKRKELLSIVEHLQRSLTSDGVFYCSFKYGTEERVDNRERWFTDMNEESLRELLEPYFTAIDIFITEGHNQKWCNAIAKGQKEKSLWL